MGIAATVKIDEEIEPWSLMAIFESDGERIAVFENHREKKSSIVYVSSKQEIASFSKTLEPTRVPEESCYLGRTLRDVAESDYDFLGEEILAAEDDPSYEEVASCFPPLRFPTFIGTRHSAEKIIFDHDGFSAVYFDVGDIVPEIAPRLPNQEARENQEVLQGLVGGWLPVVRFVFPVGERRYWEEVAFAEEDSTRFWTQPVWYRLLLVEEGKVKESHYFYHHLPFPPRGEPEAEDFYKALLKVHTESREVLEPSMKIEVPEMKINISDFCLHSLVREMITRVRDHPKYGYPPVWETAGYGFMAVDSFQDILNSSVLTFLDWGLFDIAGRYIDNYFIEFVRDDGSIDTRGPEIGQYGRILTTLAQYYNYTKDHQLILKYREKISAIACFLIDMSEDSRRMPRQDATYGVIRGWSEHDSVFRPDPFSYMLPYLSNNAEVSRGFYDLGEVWIGIGRMLGRQDFVEHGEGLIAQSEELKKDMYDSIEKSMLRDLDLPYLPGVAGTQEPYDKLMEKDRWGAAVIKGRAYSEMLHSGLLSKDMVETIIRYLVKHGGRTLGNRGGRGRMGGFLTYGYGYGLIQHDRIREFLLLYYSHMAHIYTRGTWTAVEGRGVPSHAESKPYGQVIPPGAPYASPAQLTIPALTKWMLVFEEPFSPTVWLARATPRRWLEDGKTISVKGAPTKYGFVSYKISSNLKKNRINVDLSLPEDGFGASLELRLRLPDKHKIEAVKIGNRSWANFSPGEETIILTAGSKGRINMEVVTSH